MASVVKESCDDRSNDELKQIQYTSSAQRLRVLTYNVWFAPHEVERRTEAQLLIIKEEDPDIICLQEVTPETRQSFLKGLTDKYDACPFNISGGYGIMTFSKKKFSATFCLHKCKTNMGRNILECTFGNIQILNVHLESLSNHSLREKQLTVARSIMKKPNTILCGDFNFDSDRNYSGSGPLQNDSLKRILPYHVDVWPSLHNKEKGYTFDTKTNWMIRNNQSEKFERMRYDRVLCSSVDITPINMYRVGMDPIVREKAVCTTPPPSRPPGESRTPPKIGSVAAPYHVYPSDHYGLVCDFSTNSKKGCKRKHSENGCVLC